MSLVAEAFIAIKTSAEGLASGLAAAKQTTIAGVTNIAGVAKSALASGFNVAFSSVSLAAKGAAAATTTAFAAVKSTLTAAAEQAMKLKNVFLAVGAAALGMAANADTSGVRLNAILRGTGEAAGLSREQLDNMAKAAGEAAGASQRTAREAQAALLSFGAVRGDIFQGAFAALPDIAAYLGTDLPGAARTFGAALQDPAKGLDLLKSMAVTITPQMQAAFESAANGSMAGWQRAQQFILQAVRQTAAGTAGEMQGTLAGAFARFKASALDAADALAKKLTPAITYVLDLFTKWRTAMSTAFAPLINMLKEAFGRFGDLRGVMQRYIENLQAVWTVVVSKVTPALQSFLDKVIPGFATIGDFIEENAETWGRWAVMVGEIIGGAVALWIGFNEWYISTIVEGLGSLAELFGVTWEGISDTIESVLEFLSLAFADWKKSVELACAAILYAHVVAFEEIVNAAAGLVAATVGIAMAIGATFAAMANNVMATFERMWNGMRATFTAIGAAVAAVFSGRNPVRAFRETFENEINRLGARARSYQNVGAAAASAYANGFRNTMGALHVDLNLREELRERMRALNDEINQARDRSRRDRPAPVARMGDAQAGPGVGQHNAQGLPNMVLVKFETVGLMDAWKKMQESLTGKNTMQALAQAQLEQGRRQTQEAQAQTTVLRQIDRNTQGNRPAVAG